MPRKSSFSNHVKKFLKSQEASYIITSADLGIGGKMILPLNAAETGTAFYLVAESYFPSKPRGEEYTLDQVRHSHGVTVLTPNGKMKVGKTISLDEFIKSMKVDEELASMLRENLIIMKEKVEPNSDHLTSINEAWRSIADTNQPVGGPRWLH